MKQLIMDVLEDMSQGQINLASEAARKTIANTIVAAIKTNKKGWFLDIGTIDCKPKLTKEELETQRAKESWVCDICGKSTYEVDYDYIGSGTNHLGCELKEELDEPVQTLDDGGGITYREKNWSQKKHEDKVFGNVQKQIYNEMTSDGLPEGGDSQAVLESHKLAEEIVDNKGKWIYESPDGGKTVFRRPFGKYDPDTTEEIDWETKKPK